MTLDPKEWQDYEKSLFQSPLRVLLRQRSNAIADQLIGDRGEFLVQKIPDLIKDLEKKRFSLIPGREWESVDIEHIIHSLKFLQESKEASHALLKIMKPQSHRVADGVVRHTLNLDSRSQITDADVKKASLAALFCLLRQNVGSCFATAPALLIQQEQPLQFLKDLAEMLSTGRLKRVVDGVEVSVPMCHSFGSGDLLKPFLIPDGDLNENFPFWRSPGLKLSLEKVGVTGDLKSLMEQAMKHFKSALPVVSADKFLFYILLDFFDLEEKKVVEWQKRPKERGFEQGMFHQPLMQPKGIKAFLEAFELAKTTFKTLTENPLLKTWEFTLASFAETKGQFSSWNLYSSLGMNPKEPGGIGHALFQLLEQKLNVVNEKAQSLQQEYEMAYSQIQYLRSRIKGASTEKEARWIRADYQSKANEFYTLEELRNGFVERARRYANFFDPLIDFYHTQFPRYFQEVYDPEMQEVKVGLYDDAPAGFRLLYKHGRSNTSLWTLIYDPETFVESLVSFFIATETELAGTSLFQGIEEDVGEIVTEIVTHLRKKEFIESAFDRMALAHQETPIQDPLEHLDQIVKKPWAYTSGGVINTLLSSYFRRESAPSEVSKWVENPTELLLFLVDTVKQLKAADQLERLLMHSPTHAFLFQPNFPLFSSLCQEKAFTYTWVRDTYITPAANFALGLLLDTDEILFLVDILTKNVPINFRHYFKRTFSELQGPLHIQEFRNHLLDTMAYERGLQWKGRTVLSQEEIDATLYSLLPLCDRSEAEKRVMALVPHGKSPSFEGNVISFQDVFHQARLSHGKEASDENIAHQILTQMRKESWASPEPILFADSNWEETYFAFVVNPSTAALEFWRMNCLGTTGSPMNSWKMWLDGTRQKPTWGVFHNRTEYLL